MKLNGELERKEKRQVYRALVPKVLKMSDIRISDNFCANIFEGIIEISNKIERQSLEPLPDKEIEKNIEKFLEHEEIHILISKLESKEASFLFDVIEYQTYAIWLESLPFNYLFENRDRKDCKLAKMLRFNEISKYLSPYTLAILQNQREKFLINGLLEKERKFKLRKERRLKSSFPKENKGERKMQNENRKNIDVRVDKKSTTQPSFLNLGFKTKKKVRYE